MATISNLKLEIKKGNSNSNATVSYDLNFTSIEQIAGSVLESVRLMGIDVIKYQPIRRGRLAVKIRRGLRKFMNFNQELANGAGEALRS